MTRAEMLLECVRFARESDIAEMLAAARSIAKAAEEAAR